MSDDANAIVPHKTSANVVEFSSTNAGVSLAQAIAALLSATEGMGPLKDIAFDFTRDRLGQTALHFRGYR
jgi:hypothetical protein